MLFELLQGHTPAKLGNLSRRQAKDTLLSSTTSGLHFQRVISNSAKDLIRLMLRFEAQQRLDANQVLAHTWFDSVRG